MKVKKSELYNFIKSQLQGEYYVGLHGIADSSDLANQYSNLPKLDKARTIAERGLINARGTTMGLTVRNFGNLDFTSQDKTNEFNNYGFYSPSGEQSIVVVAIPYYFEDSKGRKLFGGYKEYPTPSQYEGNNIPECITDYIFRDNIPPEMIMGYYSYNNDTDEIEYVENPNYYSRLSQAQKDAFIEKWFEPQLSYDVNNSETMEKVKRAGEVLGLTYGGSDNSPVSHTASQYEQLQIVEEARKEEENLNTSNNHQDTETNEEIMEDSELQQALTPDDFESLVQQRRLELSRRLDQFLSSQRRYKYADEESLKIILQNIQNDPEFINWLEIKKTTTLSNSEAFKGHTDLLSYKDTAFDVQVENNTLNNGNNNLLNGVMLLPVLCQPVPIPPTADHSARIVVLYKIDCGNGKYIIKEVVKEIKNYEDLFRSIFSEIERLEKEKGNVTPGERKEIYNKALANIGITDSVSFTADDFVQSYDDFKSNFAQKYGIKISDVDKNGNSTWSLNDFVVIDNRPKIDGKIISLKEQVANNGKINNNTNQNNTNYDGINPTEWFKEFVPLLVKNRKLRIRQIVKQELFYDVKSGEQACEFINNIFSDIKMPQTKEEMIALTNKLIAENQKLEKIVNLNDDDFIYPTRNVEDGAYHIAEMGAIIKDKEKNIELKDELIQQKGNLSIEEINSLFKGLTNGITFKESTDKEKWYNKPQDDIWFENEDLMREIRGYSIDELESIQTSDINPSSIKNNFETVVLSKYGIKKELILGISNSKLIHSSTQTHTTTESLAKRYGFNPSNSSEETLVNDFENYLKSQGYNDAQIEKIYRATYENNKPLCLERCVAKTSEMVSKAVQQKNQSDWEQYSSNTNTKYLDHVLDEAVKNKVNVIPQLDIDKVSFTPRLLFGKFGDVYLGCVRNDILLKVMSDNPVFEKPYIPDKFDPSIPTIKQVDVINGLKGMNQRIINELIEQKKIKTYEVDNLLKDTYIRNKDYYDSLAKVELQRWKYLLTKSEEKDYNEEIETDTHIARR